MNKYIILSVVTIGTLLGGCSDSKKQEETDATKPKVSEVKKQETTESTTENNKKTIWDSKKEAQLKSFVSSWGKEMKQDYKFYESHDELSWNDQIISKEALEKKKTIDFNGKNQTISVFSPNDEENILNIVSIISDEEDGNPENHHVYFFGLLNQEPLVLLVSEQSTTSNLVVSETKNEALKQGFYNIVNSKSNFRSENKQSDFDSLPENVKAVLLTESVDERLTNNFDDLNQPDMMFINYYTDNDYYYIFFTSGRGTGHPIYLLKDEGTSIKPLQTVARVAYDEYKEIPPKSDSIDKNQLLEQYLANKEKYQTAVANFQVQSTINEKEVFEDMIKRIGVKNKAEKQEVMTSTTKPSAEEIYRYYKEYIVYDAGINSDVLQKQMRMKGIDENGFPIIAHVVHGSEINISMDGDIINYNVNAIGGAYDDGTPAKSHLFDAFYNYRTGEHGVK